MSRHHMPCGCVHDGRKWIEMCGPEKPGEDHAGQHKERHERAQADRFAKQFDSQALKRDAVP